ncbi:energy transducer TonB [Hymenobacter wooponensis]|uniref:Energy transducer TonB n=1 Tax=Hymenobacter wooponensis TaxID=1525360 RepID=A0A4Z0MGG4_9BACT|nr:energy transducer TonB [Hymenobacter wooponensis]TGD78305.1 energy transducer TonB [Hymenobacter wooponensis]
MTNTTHTPLISFDDIVFEGRNKAYGAYVLRRIYGRHLYTAVLLATALTALLIAFPILIQRIWPSKTVAADIIELPQPVIQLQDIVIPKPEVTPPPAAQQQRVIVRPPAEVVPTVVPDALAKPTEDKPQTTTDQEGPAVVGPVAIDGPGLGEKVGIGSGKDTFATPTAPAEMKPFIHVEEMPDFVGGQAALAKYLQRHLRYPASALRSSISGRVFVAFTVNSDGTIKDVEILKGLGYGTDEEATRVIGSMPAWKPGRQNNRAVPVRYTLPITFRYE